MEKRRLTAARYPDKRGWIADVFYKHRIDHVAVINTVPRSIRGNHYHKRSTQHILITKGSLEYWYRDFDSDKPAQCVVLKEYDMVSTPPGEIHALRMIGPNQFVVFHEGLRGGKDCGKDTYRTDSIIPKRLLFPKSSTNGKRSRVHRNLGLPESSVPI